MTSSITTPTLEFRDPRELKRNKRASRKRTAAQQHLLTNAIGTNQTITPLFIDKNNTVLAGHGRLQAALDLGLDRIPVIVITHLDEPQIRAFMIADNKTVLNAEWDLEILDGELLELMNLGVDFDLSLTGFTTGEIDDRVSRPEKQADQADDIDRVDAIDRSIPAISRTGQVWQLGKHRALVGDCLQPVSLQTLMQGELAHQVLSDPPYNVAIDGHVSGLGKSRHEDFAMASGEMSSPQFIDFLANAMRGLQGHIKDGAILMLFMDWRHQAEILAAGARTGLELKNICVWDKVNGGMGSLYRSQHEFILIFKHGTARHTNNVELGKNGRYRTNIWRYPGASMFRRGRQADLNAHPTVKPVALLMDAIMDCSKHGEIILDPFGGSGSTLLAAERTHRQARIIELDPYFMDTAVRRWQAMTGKKAVDAETGKTFDEVVASTSLAA